MATDMSFAQALNEAKGVIIQLSNRVKADAEKIRGQQTRIKDQDEALARAAADNAAMAEKVKQADGARDTAEAIINRQGERITSLEAHIAQLEAQLAERNAAVAEVTRQRDELRAALPTDEDSAALASMTQLLAKAAPVIEKAKRSGMRIAGDPDETTAVAEAA